MSETTTGVAGSEAAQKVLRTHAKGLEQRHEEAIRFVLGDERGRTFLRWLINDTARTYSGTFAGEAPLQIAWNEGRRSIGIAVLAELERFDATAHGVLIAEAALQKRARLEFEAAAAAELKKEEA